MDDLVRICPGCRTTYADTADICERDRLLLMECFARHGATGALEPGSRLGPYRISQLLTRGDHGVLHIGVHGLTRTQVVVKTLQPHLAQDVMALSAYVRELYGVNQLRHPGIARLIAVGEADSDDRQVHVVTLFEDGQTLEQLRRTERPLEPAQALPICEQLCDALTAAHARGFVHRALTPARIVVLDAPPRPTIRILGFGTATLLSSTSIDVLEPTVAAPPVYSAPEQLKAEKGDGRTDVYSVGAVLFAVLTGQKPPLHRPGDRASPLADEDTGLAAKLERALIKATAPRPEDRFGSVAELHDAVRESVGEAVDAKRPWRPAPRPPASKDQPMTPSPAPGPPPRASSSVLSPVPIDGDVPDDNDATELGSPEHMPEATEVADGDAPPEQTLVYGEGSRPTAPPPPGTLAPEPIPEPDEAHAKTVPLPVIDEEYGEDPPPNVEVVVRPPEPGEEKS